MNNNKCKFVVLFFNIKGDTLFEVALKNKTIKNIFYNNGKQVRMHGDIIQEEGDFLIGDLQQVQYNNLPTKIITDPNTKEVTEEDLNKMKALVTTIALHTAKSTKFWLCNIT